MFSPYTGIIYNDLSLEKTLNKFNHFINEEKIIDNPHYHAAKLISEGEVIAWFNDGSEIGPRALGNRSILADPRRINMKDYLNHQVKHRESFRPYAPAILEEKCQEYFHIDLPNFAAYYMLFVATVRKEMKSLIPAVVHIDDTARLQIVREDINQDFYQLIKCFELITNVPLVLNTSFNGRGEPIVESPEDAIKCFLKTKIDYLFINKRLFSKKSIA